LYLEVYPDIVFIINFCFDFILVFLLKKVNKKSCSIARMALSAGTGALFAAIASVFPGMNLALRFLLIYIAASVLMIVIAFGRMKPSDCIKQWIALNLITFFVGGLMNSIYYYTDFRLYLAKSGRGAIFSDIPWYYPAIAMILAVLMVLIVLRLRAWIKSHSYDLYDVRLVYKDKSVDTRGLIDTGNCLYDPIYKKPVMVMENVLMEELIPAEDLACIEMARQYINSHGQEGEAFELDTGQMLNLRFIPYRSIGKTGMLLGIKLDKVLIDTGKETISNEKVTAAICDNRLSAKDDYHVILHKELL
jgi:stage II sporulation protein GA (sporulation sigma-E factor processing peptidase)